MARRPDTFIVGAPKSGTTSLYAYLREHPDVFMSREKEPEYFAPDVVHMRRTGALSYPDDEARYLALFKAAATETRVGEASASYLASRAAPGLIRKFAPDARIIVMLRNPVDLVYSLYEHRVTHGSEWIGDFESALAADDDRRHGRRLQLGRGGIGAAYRDYASLGEQLERWLDAFPRERVHTIVFDDFIADTAGAYARVLRYLEVDPDFRPASFTVRNARHRVRSGPVRVLLNNGLTRWLSRSATPALVGERRAAKLANRFSRARVGRAPLASQPMAKATRASLEDEFHEDVERLGGLIRRDLATEWFGRQASDSAA